MGDNSPQRPHLPDYSGACLSNIVPALLEWTDVPSWLPAPVADADQVVLLVLDGLGWEQLQARRDLAPTLCSLVGGPASSVVPSTTATALTSITTGLAPGEHGVVGYRMALEGEVLNVLRWSTSTGDARDRFPPERVQDVVPFAGQRPPIVTKAEFATSGFSGAHLHQVRFHGYRMTSTMLIELQHVLDANEPFVYAYYDGIDKVAHEYGFGEYYDAELVAVDRLVSDIIDLLPPGAALLITADHGHVETGGDVTTPHPAVLAETSMQSGEGRFRWFHARPGRTPALLEALTTHHGHQAWIRTRDEAISEGWYGPKVTDMARARMGDILVAPWGNLAFLDPADSGPYELVGRHGSVTSAEMLVPLLGAGG
ncbi:alkaline phosphatase family protein [Actinomarinicola tropica]|uniref:PglZ domain-containing protein n=1 Tax=Actinomarinicola tropica TaxID=2789776 RepID=A0A5Q2RJ42_9ACTN|nr:alkaline phosphatase family protein [Actinomarinicola tropica]QGG95534.1 PglZ domain-containing protein [Actinomarinicola tropica]